MHIFHIFISLTLWWRSWTFKTPSWSLVTWNMNTIQRLYLDIRVTVHHDKFLYNKPTRYTNFSNLFWKEKLHVSDSSSGHHQFFTVHTAMVYVIQVCWQLASGIRMILLTSCQQTCMTYTIAVCTVKNTWWWTEELSKTCRVSFQNKFKKSVHLDDLL
jgi:hypothetical protein